VRFRWAALAAIVAATVFAGTAAAKLTPAEQRWAAPLVQVWNLQNAGLHVVLPQAAAKGALIAGEKPANLSLTKTLAVLINCKVPADKIKQAGKPPTQRLAAFRDSLNAACIHDQNGANDFAKAVGAVTKNKVSHAKTYLASGVAEFKHGSAQVQKAYKALTGIGGSSIFKA
jgi:hypothetical protein